MNKKLLNEREEKNRSLDHHTCAGGFGPPAGLAMMIWSTRKTVQAA
jgi:hypothetical protein